VVVAAAAAGAAALDIVGVLAMVVGAPALVTALQEIARATVHVTALQEVVVCHLASAATASHHNKTVVVRNHQHMKMEILLPKISVGA